MHCFQYQSLIVSTIFTVLLVHVKVRATSRERRPVGGPTNDQSLVCEKQQRMFRMKSLGNLACILRKLDQDFDFKNSNITWIL